MTDLYERTLALIEAAIHGPYCALVCLAGGCLTLLLIHWVECFLIDYTSLLDSDE